MIFPINLPDFIYQRGLQVMSAYEVSQMMADRYLDGPELKPYISQFGSQAADGNKIMREVVLTSQEGKIYYLTTYTYFTDLAELEAEFL